MEKKIFKCDLCLCPRCVNYNNCCYCLYCTTKPVEVDSDGTVCDDYINKEDRINIKIIK